MSRGGVVPSSSFPRCSGLNISQLVDSAAPLGYILAVQCLHNPAILLWRASVSPTFILCTCPVPATKRATVIGIYVLVGRRFFSHEQLGVLTSHSVPVA
jgi:hypothetical protein